MKKLDLAGSGSWRRGSEISGILTWCKGRYTRKCHTGSFYLGRRNWMGSLAASSSFHFQAPFHRILFVYFVPGDTAGNTNASIDL